MLGKSKKVVIGQRMSEFAPTYGGQPEGMVLLRQLKDKACQPRDYLALARSREPLVRFLTSLDLSIDNLALVIGVNRLTILKDRKRLGIERPSEVPHEAVYASQFRCYSDLIAKKQNVLGSDIQLETEDEIDARALVGTVAPGSRRERLIQIIENKLEISDILNRHCFRLSNQLQTDDLALQPFCNLIGAVLELPTWTLDADRETVSDQLTTIAKSVADGQVTPPISKLNLITMISSALHSSLVAPLAERPLNNQIIAIINDLVSQYCKERERDIIARRFGLDGSRCQKFDEVGQLYRVTPERIRQIQEKVLRKFRHPALAGRLRPYVVWEAPQREIGQT